jgi:hypothetical protein
MLKNRTTLGVVLLVALSCDAVAQSQQYPQPQIKDSKLGKDNSHAQPPPTVNFPTSQEITDAIAAGIERANEKRETNYHAPPPDYWLNFFLVIFTGLLVVVGAMNCYLIFRTLKVTEIAVDAAKKSAEVAEKSLVIATRPRFTIPAPELCIAAQHISFSITNGGGIAIIDKVDATVQAMRGHGGVTVTKHNKHFPLAINREIEAGQPLGEYWIALDWIGAPDLRREIKSEEATLTIIFQIISKDMFGKNYPTPNIPFDFDHRRWVFEPSRLLQAENEQQGT